MTFLYPAILLGLFALPALWYILRVTPPAPKQLAFPPTKLLEGLIPDEQEPSQTPWWILLMRLLALACVIFAFAKPIQPPENQTLSDKNTPVQILIDNGWASAPHWDTIQKQALDILSQAQRQNRTAYLWALASGNKPTGPISAGEAISSLKKLEPQPWEVNYLELAKTIEKPKETLETIWLGHGIKSRGLEGFAATISEQGSLIYFQPEDSQISYILRSNQDSSARNPKVTIESPVPDTHEGAPLKLGIYGKGGKLLDQKQITFTPDKFNQMHVPLGLPPSMTNQITEIRMITPRSAGTVLLRNPNESYKTIGIVGTKGNEEDSPLINAEFYLYRALEPFGNVHIESLDKLLEIEDISVLILPDITGIAPNLLDKLDKWVKNGGTLIRFAGPNMAQANQQTFPLTPTPLRQGGRMMDGSMTWDKPVKLETLPQSSPFYGLEIDEELEIKRQLLAEPSDSLEEKTWATLSDGSPMVTGTTLERGILCMFHITATPEWSDLPLTGLYVQMLKKITQLSTAQMAQTIKQGRYTATQTLNGYGQNQQPDSQPKPVEGEILKNEEPNKDHPPGIYHMNGNYISYNLGNHTTKLIKVKKTFFPSGTNYRIYNTDFEKDFTIYFLVIATLLFLVDWLIMYMMTLTSFTIRKAPIALIIATALTITAQPNPSQAAEDIKLARETYLAYIITGDRQTDKISEAGLKILATILTQRTSVEPEGVKGINLETDTIDFYPFLYWPITDTQATPSSKAIQKLQKYMDHGGTILIDTRDQIYAPNDRQTMLYAPSRNIQKMRQLTAGLTIPALEPIDKDHVLSRSFYLLDNYQGRYTDGTLWVEKDKNNGHDGVSRVIVGSHDWAYAWAYGSNNLDLHLKGGNRQFDMATRAGVNIALYCLTGNYKADQIHLPHILERLGR